MMFSLFSQIVEEGLFPCLKMYVDFLFGKGLFLGIGIIVLPLLGRMVSIIKRLF